MNILTQLQSELSTIDPNRVKWPENKLEDGETAIGTASDDVLRIMGLRAKICDELEEIERQHRRICPPTDKTRERHDELEGRLQLLVNKGKFLNELLWLTIRMEYPQYAHKGTIGLAQNRQIWWSEGNKDEHPLSRLFGEAFGDVEGIKIIGFGGFGGRG